VTGSETNLFWATDLMHRVFHISTISEGVIDHYTHDYEEVVELAKTDPATAAIDSNALQYFAMDVYAFDVAVPGVGCSE